MHSVFLPLRSLTTPWQVSKHTQPLSNALPELKSPRHTFPVMLELFFKAEASLCDLWCVFLFDDVTDEDDEVDENDDDDVVDGILRSVEVVVVFPKDMVIFWSRGRNSSDRIRFLSLTPCGFFLDGTGASELYASSNQAHFSEKSTDFLHLKQERFVYKSIWKIEQIFTEIDLL